MKILTSTPAGDGFLMPAEFAPHQGCILIWPHRRDSWQNGAYAARKAFAELITIIAGSERSLSAQDSRIMTKQEGCCRIMSVWWK